MTEKLLGNPARTFAVSISPGNYTRRSLANQLSTIMTAGSLSEGYALTYTITVPNTASTADTGKFTYTVTGIGIESVSVTMPDTNTPSQQLGLDQGTSSDFTISPGNTSGFVVSQNVCKLQAEDTIFIRSDICDNGSASSLSDSGVLQEVFACVPDLSAIVFQVGNAGGIHANKKTLRNNKSNTFRFVITDENGDELDLNGLNVVFSLICFDSQKFQ